ncbi:MULTISPECIES: dTDP-4-dehydrorhamnose reductase [Olivibacter]|jgi:dTDP-4-dehydrorhamnose reductase|uniref:dTDP-4-dehydrorhamnose reductase n=1 Tax=Olivibacter oleidegradans TaxID=760123 RepID=A0ABV6HGZ7_9SPHI|nr:MULTISPECIES: dTDP-4-dehydrorhamnose reductase [Olivibacter]MDM8176809.1 dTDP-4-dehydrorhamnose reductase [Olivibacter sp. 47]QEL00619.1 dTDP-4-dehydrorhamnose reductase [Olivibacter sp. LS-1]
MSKIIVLGGQGQLGQCLQSVCEDKAMVFLSSKEADISNEAQLEQWFIQYNPSHIINCAAYTAVDKAEDEKEEASKINTIAPGILAGLCKRFDAILIHISTDFVFEGNQTGLLEETSIANPTGVYGQTKLDGETTIQQIWNKHIIIRTSWLYSEYANNFVKTMLRLAQDREELKVVADQVGTPTYARDLAEVLCKIIDNNITEDEYGLYHYSNEGVASWYDFAYAVFELSNTNIRLFPIKTADFPTKAKRPAYSVMDKSKIKKQFNLVIPNWRDSLKNCLQRLKEIQN